MQRKALQISIFICVMGAFSSLLRWMQNLSVFDKETGLAESGAFLSHAVFFMCLGTALALAVISLLLKRFKAPVEFNEALKGSVIIYPLGYLLFGFLMLVGAVWTFIVSGRSIHPNLIRILALLALGSSVALPAMLNGVIKPNGGLKCLCAVVSVAFLCFWLIVSYKENGANPVIWAYAIEILTIAAALLGFYYLAGYAFGRPRPRLTIFSCNLGAFLCIVTLVDHRSMGLQLIFFAMAGILLLSAASIVKNLYSK